MESLILDKEINARVAHIYNPGIHKLMLPLEVKSEDKDIGNEMAEAGFATRPSTRTDSSGSRSQELKPAFLRSSVEQRIHEAGEEVFGVSSNHRSFQTR